MNELKPADRRDRSAERGGRHRRLATPWLVFTTLVVAVAAVAGAFAISALGSTHHVAPRSFAVAAGGTDSLADRAGVEADNGDLAGTEGSGPSAADTDPQAVPEDPVPAPTSGIDDPASLSVVVNKQRPLNPASWAPSDLAYPEIPNANGQPLRYEAAVALERMHAEASAAGVPFAMVSGYRSFDLQSRLFADYAASYGVASAETFSARPGHSEHQTGLAVDISECAGCALSDAFGDTPQGVWARANAYRFGFILRYDRGTQPIVGYVYEPWHFRYVGTTIADDMRARGIVTLEEYFALPAAPNYG